jgi:two-component system nitrate/nitrite sensor histidine kinase NarX
VIVPLMSSTGPIGAITVANKRAGSLGPEDERTLTLLASSAVVALENAHLYRAEQERRRVAESLRDILNVLNSNKPLEIILNFIVSQANQLLDSQACVLYQLNPGEGLIEVLANDGLPPEMEAFRHCFRRCRPRATQPDHDLLSNHPTPSLTTSCHRHHEWTAPGPGADHLAACFGQPPRGLPERLMNEELYGSLGFHYYAQPRQFTDEEIRLAVTFDQTSWRLRTPAEGPGGGECHSDRAQPAGDPHDAVTRLFSASLIAGVAAARARDPQEGARRLEELRQLTCGRAFKM